MKVLVTGSEGLVGTELCNQLSRSGRFEVAKLDMKLNPSDELGESRHDGLLSKLMRTEHFDGIIHLAAMTRVAACERDAFKAVAYNVTATDAVLTAAMGVRDIARRPWVLFTSSREVYGDAGEMIADMSRRRVTEADPVRPINVYSRTKALGEDLVRAARGGGLRTAIVRLSSVYGSTRDHFDRVVPAFARVAGCGGVIDLVGNKVFDFVHVTDAARGLVMVCDLMQKTEMGGPDFHLVTGRGVALSDIAVFAKNLAAERGKLVEVVGRAPKDYEVTHFVGDPSRAATFLGWRAKVAFEDGFHQLATAYAEEQALLRSRSS